MVNIPDLGDDMSVNITVAHSLQSFSVLSNFSNIALFKKLATDHKMYMIIVENRCDSSFAFFL